MNLSPNFTLRELTDSATAIARGWENVPPPEVMPTLRATAAGLEAVRSLLSGIVGHDVPVLVTSGYRSPRLNREVGGSATSQHMLGEAVDFRAPQFGTPAQIVATIANSSIAFDQVISESTRSGAQWVHISFGPRNRRAALEKSGAGTRVFAG
jgi:zinc D-Ala-D-Ala carboxypeptidase